MGRSVWMTFVLAAFVATGTVLQAQDNSYISSTDGSWQISNLWSLAIPPAVEHSGIFITNDLSKTVTIDSSTASNFTDTLTVSNLTISTPSTATNTLFLSNTGTTALHILSSLTITASGAISSTNSTLMVDGTLLNNGTIVFSGGDTLILTNCSLQVGLETSDGGSSGALIISNGIVYARDVSVALAPHTGSGAISVIGGTMTISDGLGVGLGLGGLSGVDVQGLFLATDGALVIITNGISVAGGGGTSLIISNSTLLADEIAISPGNRSPGNFSINDGTVTLSGPLNIGTGFDNNGNASLNGGALTVTNADTTVADNQHEIAGMTVSGGLFATRSLLLGTFGPSTGSFYLNGGVVLVNSNLSLGCTGGNGNVTISGGLFVVTNGLVTSEGIPVVPLCQNFTGCQYPSRILVGGGEFMARTIELARPTDGFNDVGGMLIVTSGVATVSDGITLGVCGSNDIGYVWVSAGQLIVTNNTGTGFIDIQNGELLLSNGVVHVDELVMTNSCGQLIHVGGTLVVGNFILGPNAPRITSIVPQGSDMNISWILGPGQTNALQATAGAADGSYSTNGFTDIFVVTNTVTAGSVTNYIDPGAVTNSPSRYYRVRWPP